MLQETTQFDFPRQPTFAEAVRMISLWWLIGSLLIASGARLIYSNKKLWLKGLAVVAFALGFFLCFLLGYSFTPMNRHRLIAWVEDNRDLNYWIDLSIGLAIWASGLLIFLAIRKRRQSHINQPNPDAN